MKKVLEKIKNWFVNLVEKFKNIKWKRVFSKARNISLVLAGVFVMSACVIYVFSSDLFATNTSFWLLGGSLLGFGAGILALLSEVKKEDKILVFSLKGGAIFLMVGFVVFLAMFERSDVVTSLDETDRFLSLFIKNLLNKPDGYTGIECLKAIKLSMVFTYVLTGIGMAIQVFNITSNAILGIEE